MSSIPADYLGGDPEKINAVKDGTLTFTEAGGMAYAVRATNNVMDIGKTVDLVTLDVQQIKAISIGDANHMRALTRGAAGTMIGGSIGGLIGMATGKRNTMLVIAAERDNFPFAATFAVQPDHAMALLTEIQADRRRRGEPPMPKLEDLAGQAATEAVDEQLQLLRDIRGLLMEQNALLREGRGRVE
jgi:hypothetical protein